MKRSRHVVPLKYMSHEGNIFDGFPPDMTRDVPPPRVTPSRRGTRGKRVPVWTETESNLAPLPELFRELSTPVLVVMGTEEFRYLLVWYARRGENSGEGPTYIKMVKDQHGLSSLVCFRIGNEGPISVDTPPDLIGRYTTDNRAKDAITAFCGKNDLDLEMNYISNKGDRILRVMT